MEPRSLLRFVQVRRLTDAGDPATCTTGPGTVRPCFDFSDDWSPGVREALAGDDPQLVRALYRERRDGLRGAAEDAARLALALLRLAAVNERLTVGQLRERVPAGSTGFQQAATWAVDMLVLRR